MQIKNILLSSDDGYKSAGIRLLITALKDKYNLTIAATTTQQTGVGGKLSIDGGFNWSIDKVDGIRAFKVDGTPSDAMDMISHYHDDRHHFDLIISGVNWGANLGSSVFGSGTVNAALRGLGLEVAPHAIAMSWDLPREYYLQQHNGDEDLKDFLKYPGKTIGQIVELAIENEFWDSRLINVNFPQKFTNKVLFTAQLLEIKKIYPDNPELNRKMQKSKSGSFSYFKHNTRGGKELTTDLNYDVGAINKGYIAITPCSADLLDEGAFEKVRGKRLKLG